MKNLTALVVLTAGIAASAGAMGSTPITNSEVERLVQSFYDRLADYDYAGMHAASTPEFEIIEHNGTKAMRMDWDAFDERLAGAQKAGAVLKFTTAEFYTTLTPDVAYTTYVETSASSGKQYYGGIILRRAGDQWLVDRFFTLPKPEDPPAAEAAAPAEQ